MARIFGGSHLDGLGRAVVVEFRARGRQRLAERLAVGDVLKPPRDLRILVGNGEVTRHVDSLPNIHIGRRAAGEIPPNVTIASLRFLPGG